MLRNGSMHARVASDPSGLFAFVPQPLPPGTSEIVLQSIAPDGTRMHSRESVTIVVAPKRDAKPLVAMTSPDRPTVVGQGWTSVVVAKLPADALSGATAAGKNGDRRGPGFSLDALPKVSGSWGSGHLLTSRLFSVLITDDGRVLAGAVRPDRLYQAAAK